MRYVKAAAYSILIQAAVLGYVYLTADSGQEVDKFQTTVVSGLLTYVILGRIK